MTQHRRTPHAERLLRILKELGYADDRTIHLGRLAADISRRARGNIREDQLRAILHRGRAIETEELVTICEGLDIDAYEVLYGEDGPPMRRRRPKGVNLMDVIEKPL
jgi:hypothetical protein